MTSALLEKAKKKSESKPTYPRSPAGMSDAGGEPSKKKIKLEKNDRSPSLSPQTPLPPSAQEVVKKLSKKRTRGSSASPAPSNASDPKTPPSTGPVDPSIDRINPDEITAEDLIRAIKSKPQVTLKEMVSGLKTFLVIPSNKAKLKELIRQCCHHDKKTGFVSLREAYQ